MQINKAPKKNKNLGRKVDKKKKEIKKKKTAVNIYRLGFKRQLKQQQPELGENLKLKLC